MKYLINIDENGCLDMHDIIQDMARQVVINESPEKPNERSRLWDHNDVIRVLLLNEVRTITMLTFTFKFRL
jgi:hypothetical protein